MKPTRNPLAEPTPSRRSGLPGARWIRRARSGNRWTSRHSDEGVTLVEVLVAFVLLLVVMLPMGILLTDVSKQAALARQRQAALQLADSWVSVLSNASPPTGSGGQVLTNTPQPPTAPTGVIAPASTLAGTAYAVTANYTEALVNNVGQSDLCADGEPPSPSHPGVIQVQVTVSWDRGRYSVADTTNISYPKPGLQTEGFLAVDVTNDGRQDVFGNSATTRLEAMPVTITQEGANPTLSPNPDTLYPDSNGCVFAQVPVGTYDVKLVQPVAGTPATFQSWPGSPAFVTPGGLPQQDAGTQSVTVTAESVVQLQAFDEGINGSISYGGASSADGALTCPGASRLECLVTGNGTGSATAAWGNGSSTWNTTNLANTTNINQVGCTSAGSPTCVAVGDNLSGGVVLTTSGGLRSASPDSVPGGVSDLTNVVCPSANGCYATGVGTTGPVLLAGAVGQGSGSDVWSTVSLPSPGFTTINSIACPTTTTCLVTGVSGGSTPAVERLDGDPATLATNAAWTPAYSTDALPTGAAGTTTVGEITCPTNTTCEALATGDASSSSDPTIITTNVANSGADTWTVESTFPTGGDQITSLDCTASTCLAVGTGADGSPAVWTGDLTTSPHAWLQSQNIPPSVLAVTSASCGLPDSGDTADCILGVVTNDASAPGQLLNGVLYGGSWVWNLVTPQTTSTVQYYLGVSCVSPDTASDATCMAVGATGSGPVIVTTTSGPNGGWTAQSDPGGSGAVVNGIPLQTSPSSNTEWTTQVTATSAQAGDSTFLPNVLYPDPGGYSLSAGDCSDQATGPSLTSLDALPGGTAQATVPLDLLSLQVVGPTGAPLPGATVTLTSTECSQNDVYTLPTSDAAGMTSSSLPYGSYTYTVSAGGTTYPANGEYLILGGQTVGTQATGQVNPNISYLPSIVQVQA